MQNNLPIWEIALLSAQVLILAAQVILMFIMHRYNRNNNRESRHKARILEVISRKMIEEQIRHVKFSVIHNELNKQYPKEKYTKSETYYLLGILKSEGVVHNTLGDRPENRDPDLFTAAHRFLTEHSEI